MENLQEKEVELAIKKVVLDTIKSVNKKGCLVSKDAIPFSKELFKNLNLKYNAITKDDFAMSANFFRALKCVFKDKTDVMVLYGKPLTYNDLMAMYYQTKEFGNKFVDYVKEVDDGYYDSYLKFVKSDKSLFIDDLKDAKKFVNGIVKQFEWFVPKQMQKTCAKNWVMDVNSDIKSNQDKDNKTEYEVCNIKELKNKFDKKAESLKIIDGEPEVMDELSY